MTKEVPDWQALRALANFNKLGPGRVFKKIQKDTLYIETRKKHSEDNQLLTAELKPMFQFAEKIGGLLGIEQIEVGEIETETKVYSDDGSGREKMFSFITDRLVTPDLENYVNLLRKKGLIPSTPKNAHPIVMQRLEKRYVALFEDWTEKLTEILAR